MIFRLMCVRMALLVALLAVSVPVKRYLTATQVTIKRDFINVALVQRIARFIFLNHTTAASQFYHLQALLYLTQLDYPHYHLHHNLEHEAEGTDDHDHAHKMPACNAHGEPYVGCTHGPGGEVPLTQREIDAIDARIRYIDRHLDEFFDADHFYDLLGLANALDPDNEYVLDVGRAWILNQKMAARMVGLLTDAYVRNHGWRSMFEAGWIKLYYLRDNEGARRLLQIAARETNAPPFVAMIYANSFYADRKYQAALEQLAMQIKATQDHDLVMRLEQRFDWYQDLLRLNRAAQSYRERFGKDISRLDDLVTNSLLKAVPSDRFGNGFEWDAHVGEVISKNMDDALRHM